jgi:hypothetical protein
MQHMFVGGWGGHCPAAGRRQRRGVSCTAAGLSHSGLAGARQTASPRPPAASPPRADGAGQAPGGARPGQRRRPAAACHGPGGRRHAGRARGGLASAQGLWAGGWPGRGGRGEGAVGVQAASAIMLCRLSCCSLQCTCGCTESLSWQCQVNVCSSSLGQWCRTSLLHTPLLALLPHTDPPPHAVRRRGSHIQRHWAARTARAPRRAAGLEGRAQALGRAGPSPKPTAQRRAAAAPAPPAASASSVRSSHRSGMRFAARTAAGCTSATMRAARWCEALLPAVARLPAGNCPAATRVQAAAHIHTQCSVTHQHPHMPVMPPPPPPTHSLSRPPPCRPCRSLIVAAACWCAPSAAACPTAW